MSLSGGLPSGAPSHLAAGRGAGASDVVVVGAGLAGLVAAARLADAGARVTLVASGRGGLPLGQGSVDVLGYRPERVVEPYAELPGFVAGRPDHPYALLAPDAIRGAVGYLATLAGADLLAPPGERNLQLPTAVGAIRPTLAAPPSLAAADLAAAAGRFVVAGLRRFKDFPAPLVAANLARQDAPGGGRIEARSVVIDLPGRPGETDVAARTYATLLDAPETVDALARLLDGLAEPDETILLPAVLGLRRCVADALAERLGRAVAEVATQPPSVPGLRLQDRLTRAVRARGVRLLNGATVVGRHDVAGRVDGVDIATAGRIRTLPAHAVVFAPGGFESGALAVDSHGRITEPAFGLPLTADDARGLVVAEPRSDQPLFAVGVRADAALRPLSASGDVAVAGVHVAGGILAGAQRWSEKSGDGIAVASGVRAADAIIEELA